MAATRVHTHHPLPAPVVHAGFSIPQSKSHVLAGVQDAYWSDDEAEDAECPLCLEEMDISDLNFKPCICGYQICRFCWHHIKENLNGRCPACRRVYTDEAVEFKPIAKEDHKRLTQQKKQRDRERKELDALNRRHLANVRVVQRNVVYVVGIGPRFAKEELIPTLRSNEYFGQYGKISKIILVKRTPSGGGAPVVGLYITYNRREDAARSIAAVDGTASPGGGREVMRASYGTTKYCMSFLRSVPCNDHGCMNLHEWGDEKDCFTKEDLTTLKHTMKATESRRNTSVVKKAEEAEGLPRAAAWAQKSATPPVPLNNNTNINNAASTAITTSARPARRGGGMRQTRNSPAPEPRMTTRANQDRKTAAAGKTPSQPSSSRPSTPALATLPQRPVTPADSKPVRQKKEPQPQPPAPAPPRSPAPSTAAESDTGSGSQDVPIRPESAESSESSVPSVPPGIPIVPPGLSAPPGLPPPNRPPRVQTASPQTPLLASQSSYQMSNAARALLDDVKARRDHVMPAAATISPFPDFDRTLQTLSGGDGGFGFSFNLDPKLAGDEANADILPVFEVEAATPFHGSYVDAFPALRSPNQATAAFMAPPGLQYPHNPNRAIYDPMAIRPPTISPIEHQTAGGSNYTGSFNPFADANEDGNNAPPSRPQYSPLDDDPSRKVSRFGFARGRQGSTATSSPLHASSTLSNSDSNSFYNSADNMPLTPPPPQWNGQQRPDYGFSQTNSAMASPHMQHTQTQAMYSQQQSRFQPFESGVSEAQLRDLIQTSRERTNPATMRPAEQPGPQFKYAASRPTFNDPAIMSASFSLPSLGSEAGYPLASALDNLNISQQSQLSYGPPPGLSFPHGMQGAPMNGAMVNGHGAPLDGNGSAHVPTLSSPEPLSSSDFPALTPSQAAPNLDTLRESSPPSEPAPPVDDKAQEKADKKATKKAAAAEKAAEKQQLAQEKAAARAAEKVRVALEKASERERVAAKVAAEKAALEEAERARIESEAAAREKAEKERQAQMDKAAQAAKDKAAAGKKAGASKAVKQPETVSAPKPSAKLAAKAGNVVEEPTTQVPLLSKKPKKNKPITRPIRVPKEESNADETSTIPSASTSDTPRLPVVNKSVESSSNNSRAESLDRNMHELTSVEELLEEIDVMNPAMDLPNHPFFDMYKINPAAKMPLEYGPLVHALSALSVGGGSFANNMPSGSIDNAVSSFQQLLETLTQTISDLLRLLPRTTWDDSSSFDGVLRDMLKGDDFLDDGGEDVPGKEDEVATLTLALERRARWMEVQLSKLEELHRDINTAAVRAVLAFNDNGWDRHGALPRVGNTLRRFDSIGTVEEGGVVRPMTADELEKKLVVAREAAVFVEAEVREVMERIQEIKPIDDEM